MPAATFNFDNKGGLNRVIEMGATFERTLTWKTGRPLVPVNLNGYTARMQLRRTLESADVALELSTEAGSIAISDPSSGRITLQLTAAETAELEAGEYRYDLVMTAPSGGEITRLLEGKITVTEAVTR